MDRDGLVPLLSWANGTGMHELTKNVLVKTIQMLLLVFNNECKTFVPIVVLADNKIKRKPWWIPEIRQSRESWKPRIWPCSIESLARQSFDISINYFLNAITLSKMIFYYIWKCNHSHKRNMSACMKLVFIPCFSVSRKPSDVYKKYKQRKRNLILID
jgi:hypothetical protein